MAAPAAELFVKLGADIAGFRSDLAKATGMAEGFAKTFRSAIGGAVAGLVGALSVGAFVRVTKAAIDTADEMGKMAQKVGTSVETLSEMDVAARMANVSTDQLTAGFKQLARGAAEFAGGGGEAADAYRALGMSQEQVNALSDDTAKLFDAVAGKLAGFADGANKTALAMKIFGKSGAELIPLINDLEKTRKEAALLGAVIGSDTAQAANRFNDNLTRVGVVIRGISMRLAEAMLPTLEKLSEQWVKNAKDARDLGAAGRIADAGLKILATAGALTVHIFAQAGRVLGGFAAMMAAFVDRDWKEAGKQAARIALEVGTDFVESGRKTAEDLQKLWDDAGARAEKDAPKLGKKLAAPMLVSAQEVEKARKAQADAINRMHDDIIAGIEADAEILKRQTEGADSFRAALIEPHVQAAQAAQDAADSMVYTYDNAGNRVVMTMEKWNEQTERLRDASRDLGFTMSSAFEDAVLEGKKLSDVLKGLAQDIARIVMRLTVTQPMANAIAGALNNAFGVGASARAEGGPVSAGQAYIVGERGPELFVPGSAGQVVPNNEIFARGAAAGRSQTRVVNNRYVAHVTLNVGSLDPRGAAAVIAANSDVIRGVIRGAFNRQGRRSPI